MLRPLRTISSSLFSSGVYMNVSIIASLYAEVICSLSIRSCHKVGIFELFATQYNGGVVKGAPRHGHDLLGSTPL